MMSFLTPRTNIPKKMAMMMAQEKTVLQRISMMRKLSMLPGMALNRVSWRQKRKNQIPSQSFRVYNFVLPLVNTVSDAATGQPEAVNIAKEEEPDEKDLNDNQFILSSTKAVGQNSFVDFRRDYDHASPPPKYFDEEILLAPLPSTKKDIMKGLIEPEPYGGLVCTDQEAMDRQKGVLVDVVKQLAVTLLKGLTIAHISLPIKIFEPRSSI